MCVGIWDCIRECSGIRHTQRSCEHRFGFDLRSAATIVLGVYPLWPSRAERLHFGRFLNLHLERDARPRPFAGSSMAANVLFLHFFQVAFALPLMAVTALVAERSVTKCASA
jgi:hypothetical protein